MLAATATLREAVPAPYCEMYTKLSHSASCFSFKPCPSFPSMKAVLPLKGKLCTGCAPSTISTPTIEQPSAAAGGKKERRWLVEEERRHAAGQSRWHGSYFDRCRTHEGAVAARPVTASPVMLGAAIVCCACRARVPPTLVVPQVMAALLQRAVVAEIHILAGTVGSECVELPGPH